MLQLRPNCECCNTDLPPHSTEALICSLGCTFAEIVPPMCYMACVRIVAGNWSDDLCDRRTSSYGIPQRRNGISRQRVVSGLEMVRRPKAVAGYGLYPLHPGPCFASALRVQSPRRSHDSLFSRRRMTA